MSSNESLIDPTNFGTVYSYLRNPASPIHCILHVKSREMLAPLADTIDRAMETGGFKNGVFPDDVKSLVKNGAVKLSYRDTLQVPRSPWLIDPLLIRQETVSYVIYQPPFYLAYTPGLFEGLHRIDDLKRSSQTTSDGPKSSTQTSKEQSKGKGHEISH